tara:strand:- start:5985 stop:6161 length:177 start_codon:yes stop_codon:yes gene_type:complete
MIYQLLNIKTLIELQETFNSAHNKTIKKELFIRNELKEINRFLDAYVNIKPAYNTVYN